jgi:hypothetical protein
MTLLYPERVAAAWLRSGVPLLKEDPARSTIKPHSITAASLAVPIMCNLGTKEGVSVKEGRFVGVWPANESFFKEMRSKGGLVGVAVDPMTAHECGNQRYLAIAWLDACLEARLPQEPGAPLRTMSTASAWIAPLLESEAVPVNAYAGDVTNAVWLPNQAVATAWMQYVKDTVVSDTTPPPPPTNVRVVGNELSWDAEADLESGLSHFLIQRDGTVIGRVPETSKNPFGRPVFQGLQYSDTPGFPLMEMKFTDTGATSGMTHHYRVISVNTAGIESQ